MAAVGKNWKAYALALPEEASPRVPSWERAPAFSPRTMKRRAVFILQSRSEGCSLATMRAGRGFPRPKDWMIPTYTRFYLAPRPRDSLSPPAVRAPIAARIAGNIGRILRRQEIAISDRMFLMHTP